MPKLLDHHLRALLPPRMALLGRYVLQTALDHIEQIGSSSCVFLGSDK
jgi:hypothetical protein